VKSGDCRPWIALRESVHSRNFLGGRLNTALSDLHSARSLAGKNGTEGVQSKFKSVYI
jgi:hypothetical protein